jgi:hypothetical protein
MAENKATFGLDQALLEKIDWTLALKRILQDLRSDFIYAPHLRAIYQHAGKELSGMLVTELKSGTFSPGIPITLDVPKSFRIRVVRSKRLGPNHSRPGSILPPKDRLLYQALADQATPMVQAKTDIKRSFSHLLAPAGSHNMFMSTRYCWNELQKALKEYAKSNSIRYILKIDVANFFGSLNQHTLINVLIDSGYRKELSMVLEKILTSYASQRSSRGILQGIYPSDLLGNFYLAPIDRFLKEYGVPSARYVDDIYIFMKTVDDADHLLRSLIPRLRSYDLVLNEAKSVIMPKSALVTEEPDLDTLFAEAIEEISEQMEDEDFHADYGFQSDWDDEGVDQEELELKATMLLFDSLSDYPGHEENIERFCLPIFTTAGSDYAVEHVMASFKKRPSMTQIYSSYISKFLDTTDVYGSHLELLEEEALVDWQKMWILAALSHVDKASDDAVKTAWDLLKDPSRHETLRAVAAIYVGFFGDHARRKELASIYVEATNYVQAAIYYASNKWPVTEKRNAKANWSGNGPMHTLLTTAMNYY